MKLENVVHIDAPQEVVWAVTEDIERWPEWTPSVESVTRIDHGQFDVGSAALIKQPGLPEAKWFVTAFTRGERFTWESRVRGIRMIATHEIRNAASGTQSVLRVANRITSASWNNDFSKLKTRPADTSVYTSAHTSRCNRKTRGQDGFATSFPVGLFHPLQHAGLSRRFPC